MIFQLLPPYKSIDANLILPQKGQRSNYDYHLNKLGRAWVLDAIYQEGQTMIIIWTNLVELESSMLYTKIQPPRFLGAGEEDF